MKYLIPLLSLSLVVACGKSENKRKAPTLPLVTESKLEESFIPVKKQNTQCLEKAFLDTNFNLHLLMKGTVLEESRDLYGLLTGNLIKNIDGNVISESFYAGAYDIIVTDNATVVGVTNQEQSILTVCPEDKDYERETYESSGLNVSYFINKTYKKIKGVLPSLKIEPISLNIIPQIRVLKRTTKSDHIEEKVSYQTDNAYYMPSEKSITFLPHSHKKKSEGQESNFWEVPMVASHEYGHHIFSTIAPNTAINDLHMGNCFDDGSFILEGRTVNQDLVLSAFNEGFADLISFYTLSADERSLKAVIGLEKTRDVDSNVFASGGSKKFSDLSLKIFFMPYNIYTTDNLQGIHTVGAIFANGVDKFMTTLGADNDKKLEITLTWLQEVNTQYPSMKSLSPSDFMKRLLTMFVQQAMRNTDLEYNAGVCADIDKLYPGLKSTLVGCGIQTITI